MTPSSTSLLALCRLCSLRSLCRVCMLLMHNLSLLQGVFDISTSLLLINSTENEVHLFQGPALGLFEEHDDEDTHGKAEDAKHEEGFPANLIDSARGNLGDDEVEQPLCGGSETDTVGAKTSWEDLSEQTMSVNRNGQAYI